MGVPPGGSMVVVAMVMMRVAMIGMVMVVMRVTAIMIVLVAVMIMIVATAGMLMMVVRVIIVVMRRRDGSANRGRAVERPQRRDEAAPFQPEQSQADEDDER